MIRTAAGPFSAEKVELLKKEVEAFEDLKKKTSGLGLFEIQKVHSATEHATIKLLTGKTGALYLPEVQKAEDLRFCQTKAKIGKTKNLTDLPEPIRRELKQALSTNVSLTGGGSVCFERTTAMHTADVNSAGYNAKTPYAQAVASINKAAATCIAEQICLRNLSGLIAIDFISGEEKSVATELVGAMQTILESGKQKFEIQAVDAFGICILSRRRSGLSLDDVLGFDRQNLRKHL